MSESEPKLFISYRRDDSSGHAGRLFDALAPRIGEDNIFMDVDLEPGVDFVERIHEGIGACRVLLVVIGPRWVSIVNEDGVVRLSDPEDFVRLEVETALARADLTVIPVLVGGARMPDAEDLPEGIRPLAHRNAIELSDLRWRYDFGRLNARIDKLFAAASGGSGPAGPGVDPETLEPVEPPPAARQMSPSLRFVLEGMLVAGLAGFAGRVLSDPIDPSARSNEAAQIFAAVAKRSLGFAIVGAALAAWLTYVRGENQLLAGRTLAGLGVGALGGLLAGLITAVPERLPDPNLDPDTVHTISILAIAVAGAMIGSILGALWTPRSVWTGVIAGFAAGAAVRLFWNLVDSPEDSAIESGLQFGFQSLMIVGIVMLALRAFAGEGRAAITGRANGSGSGDGGRARTLPG